MTKVKELKKHLRPGQVYRRADFEKWSNAVDRHLQQLADENVLQKLAGGLYYYPKQTSFGAAPPEDHKLVQAFLKEDCFLLTSPNAYNSLGVGTTQLYSETVVYNHKRHGKFKLGGRVFDFRVKPRFPKTLSREFLLVDLVNNVTRLAEDQNEVLARVKEKTVFMDAKMLKQAVNAYAGARAKKFFNKLFENSELSHAA